jgi:hypothetical protein
MEVNVPFRRQLTGIVITCIIILDTSVLSQIYFLLSLIVLLLDILIITMSVFVLFYMKDFL